MVPKFFVVMDSMPLSANGKVLRNKLPRPEISDVAEAGSEDTVLPSTALEKRIASCFSTTLQIGHDLVDVNTSFFNMGGNSLTALHVLMELREKVGINLSVADFLESPSISKLAQFSTDHGLTTAKAQSE